MTTEMMDCYVPEGNEVDSGPIVKENYEGILDKEASDSLSEIKATMAEMRKAIKAVN